MPKTQLNSFPPPSKVRRWDRLFLRIGDIWEQRINDWGVWEPEVLGRWVWDGKHWVESNEGENTE